QANQQRKIKIKFGDTEIVAGGDSTKTVKMLVKNGDKVEEKEFKESEIIARFQPLASHILPILRMIIGEEKVGNPVANFRENASRAMDALSLLLGRPVDKIDTNILLEMLPRVEKWYQAKIQECGSEITKLNGMLSHKS
ncbi:MAG: hypothetical protein AABZ57_00490, partial [Candidatus Margulisiibacteriota bacterium]